MFYIYMFKNKLNDKVYIGETGNIKRRRKDHIGLALSKGYFKKVKQQLIHKAINKYGIDNFEFSIIDQFDNFDDAMTAEIRYIKQYKSKNRKYGYNLTDGGEGFINSPNKKLSKKQVVQLIKDYVNQDISMKKLSIRYNISRDSVHKILTKQNYYQVKIPKKLFSLAESKMKKKDNSKKTNPNIISNIIEDSKTLDNRSIANKYNLSIEWVRKIINKKPKINTVNKKSSAPHNQEFVLSILNDYVTGKFKAKDLSEKYSISIDSVRGILSGQTIRHLVVMEDLMNQVREASKQHIGFKLNEEIVKSIFQKYSSGNYSLSSLAKEFNVKSIGTIYFILKRKTWAKVNIDNDLINKVNKILNERNSKSQC